MKNIMKLFVQSCDSRECRKKHKNQINDMCEAVTTIHYYNPNTKEVICTECGKSYKLSN
jgi:hypothetical protein